MSQLDLNALNDLPKVDRVLALAETNAQLETLTAEERVAWALENLPGEYVLSSSFGIQAAVSLHLVNQIRPDIPVILTDTGYLFPETYQFIDELTDKLKLNLKVYRAGESPAWQEARYGKLWEQGVEGIEKYNDINKVEPMNRALKELKAQTWFAGLRREQSGSRAHLPVLAIQRGVFKVLPIIDWDNRNRLPVPAKARPEIPSAVGSGLSVGGRYAHHPQMGAGYGGRRDTLLRTEARVRAA